MAVTRAKATALLNKTEMGLYDDSRANALRDHSEARLTQLVSRARTARDRARDLEKRQRLASRKTSGSKSGRTGVANARTGEKAELLADILGRLETRHRDVAKAAKTAAKAKPAKTAAKQRTPAKVAKKAAAKKTVTKSAATTKSAKKAALPKKSVTSASASKTTTKKSATTPTRKASSSTAAAATAPNKARKPVANKAAAKPSAAAKSATPAATKPAVRKAAKVAKPKAASEKAGKPSGRGKRGITPEQALENTRKLLEQRDADAKGSKSWETLGTEGAAPDAPGFQSPQARSKALALHEAETRQASINGSISTRDRRNQGKRDHRND